MTVCLNSSQLWEAVVQAQEEVHSLGARAARQMDLEGTYLLAPRWLPQTNENYREVPLQEGEGHQEDLSRQARQASQAQAPIRVLPRR